MTSRRTPLFSVPLALVLLALAAPGCAPRRIEASPQGFSGSGIADFAIRVAPPLTLAASGRLTARVPSDDALVAPIATVAFAAFAEGDKGPVTRHAHTMFCELPLDSWRWEMETWGKRDTLLRTSERKGGKYWTAQIFPVVAAGDWFSDLWLKNGRPVPEFWLAKRWSSTPQEEMRLLAEYREPAPACMRDRLARAVGEKGAGYLPDSRELWRDCDQAIRDFGARADAVFDLERLRDRPAAAPAASAASVAPAASAASVAPAAPAATAAPAAGTFTPPDSSPNMGALAGRAEALTRFTDNR